VIRSAVTMLLEATDRSTLTPGAARWRSAEDLVEAIASRPEYAGHFKECSGPLPKFEYGTFLLRDGRPGEALQLLLSAHEQLEFLTADMLERVVDAKSVDPERADGLRPLWYRWLTLAVQAGLSAVRALIDLGENNDALRFLTNEMDLETPGSGVEFEVPSAPGTFDYDFTYWKYDETGLAYNAWDASLLRSEITLHQLRGEAFAHIGQSREAIILWENCVRAAQQCADDAREDLAAEVTGRFQERILANQDIFRQILQEPRGLAVVRRTFAAHEEHRRRRPTTLRTWGPDGAEDLDASDVEIEINELELAVGRGAIDACYDLSLAMRDKGEAEIADRTLEEAAERGAPLAIQELGLTKLADGDPEGGIILLGQCLDHPQCGMAQETVAQWALESGEVLQALEWAPALSRVLKSR
jgi:tetratricopeptide (TPR) repeat protein